MTHFDSLTLGVLGLGHVGLPTALALAELGWPVLGGDDDPKITRLLRQGEIPFHESGLQNMLRKHLDTERFQVSPDVSTVIRESEVLFVCVGTPQRDDGSADLSQVESVARTIAKHLNGYKLIVEKSTVPVRTAERLKLVIEQHAASDHHFDVAVNPEFLREGTALDDFLNPERIVLGVDSDRARKLLLEIYGPLIERIQRLSNHGTRHDLEKQPGVDTGRLIVTDLNTAEIIKHASNSFLAMRVSFINVVSDLCQAAGADVEIVAKGMGADSRIGPHFLRAGLGFGGYCLPKDLTAFTRIGEEYGIDMTLLKAVSDINDARVERLLSSVRQALWVLEGKVLAIWGLSFKPGTNDVREAPSRKVVAHLLDQGASLRLYDPKAMNEFRALFPETSERLVYCGSPGEASRGADAILLLTEWSEFKEMDLAEVRDGMALPVIVDGRNLLDPDHVRQLGFEYHAMGR